MKIDSLKRYAKMRQSLLVEKSAVETRLRAISEALGEAVAKKHTMSAAGRAKIAAAQRARWAKFKAAKKKAK